MHTCVQADKACTSTLQTMQCNARQHGREGRERRVFGFRDGYCPGYLELKAWKFLDLAELAVARWRGKEGAFARRCFWVLCVRGFAAVAQWVAVFIFIGFTDLGARRATR